MLHPSSWASNSPAWDRWVTHDQKTHLHHQGQGHGSEYNSEADDISLKEMGMDGCQHTTWRLQSIAAIHTLTSLQTA
jgi:hypothetical protein